MYVEVDGSWLMALIRMYGLSGSFRAIKHAFCLPCISIFAAAAAAPAASADTGLSVGARRGIRTAARKWSN